jgi:hypothetical protein
MLFCKDDRLHHPDEVRLTQGSLIVTSSVTILPIYNVVYVQRHILLGSASVCAWILHTNKCLAYILYRYLNSCM